MQPPTNQPLKVALIVREGSKFPRSSAFIRLISPLTSSPSKKQVSLMLIDGKKPDIQDDVNVVVVQRTAIDNKKAAQELVNQLKGKHAKLVVDSDDAFAHISESHPEFEVQSKRIEAYEYLLESANQIWLSVAPLVQDKFRAKSIVIPNSLDKKLWQPDKPKNTKTIKQSSPLKLLYMGTATHDSDFNMILPALDELNQKHPKSFKLTVIGVSQDLPDRDWIKRLYTPRFGALYPTFVKWFKRQGPFDIGLAPLVDSSFNGGKSDIKCLDYIALGALPVVSDVLAYQGKELDGLIIKLDNSQQAWFEYLSSVVADRPAFRAEKARVIAKGQKYIWDKRSSQSTAKKILMQLEDLAS